MKTHTKTQLTPVAARAVILDGEPDVGSERLGVLTTLGDRAAASLLALFLGSFLLYGVGFSPAVHDLAHDTRHAIGFPCH